MSDYISREAAKQILSRMLTDNAAECACNLIDSVLPADVEPVRHVAPIDCGMDEYYGGWVRCPNCDFDLNTSVAKFCGGCGAKMDLEDKHEN